MGTNELVEATASATAAMPAATDPEAPSILAKPDAELPRSTRLRPVLGNISLVLRSAHFRNTFGNICLALLFFTALLPFFFTAASPTAKGQYHSPLANDIFLAGAVLMGVLSLVRVPPRSSMVNLRSILATAAMMTIPALMRPGISATGLLFDLAIAIELIGIAFTQISRIYLGRRFGLLPANRGIVSGGPFRWMRHPIYSGWLVLTIGFLMAYPTPRNIGMLFLSLPFLVWRMDLEEEHLNEDPEYRAYAAKTPYRLIPRIY
jgi:protein-S-isoprenylcysteine O-methyltransferase Ste14